MMAVDFGKIISFNEVLKEFVSLYDECYIACNSTESTVPLVDLIQKIASSVHVQSFAGTSSDLEDLVKKLLNCSPNNIINQNISREEFISKISEFFSTFYEEFHPLSDDFLTSEVINDSSNCFSSNYLNSSKSDATLIRDTSKTSYKDIEELIIEKKKLESLCSDLQDRIRDLEKSYTSLANKKNTLHSSFSDATKRESELELTINQLKNKIKLFEERNNQLMVKFSTVEEALKKEKENNNELQQNVNSKEERILLLKQQIASSECENQMLLKNVDDLEKRFESLNLKYSASLNDLQHYRCLATSLQEQSDDALKKKQSVENELKEAVRRLHLVNILYEDLEMANNNLKDKFLSAQGSGDNQRIISSLCKNVSDVCNSTPELLDVKNLIKKSQNCVYTSTPYPPKNKDDCKMLSPATSYDDISELNPTDFQCTASQGHHKSLKDELQEAELDPKCSEVENISSYSSRVDSLLVEKIEEQQLVIKQLTENIMKYSEDNFKGVHDHDTISMSLVTAEEDISSTDSKYNDSLNSSSSKNINDSDTENKFKENSSSPNYNYIGDCNEEISSFCYYSPERNTACYEETSNKQGFITSSSNELIYGNEDSIICCDSEYFGKKNFVNENYVERMKCDIGEPIGELYSYHHENNEMGLITKRDEHNDCHDQDCNIMSTPSVLSPSKSVLPIGSKFLFDVQSLKSNYSDKTGFKSKKKNYLEDNHFVHDNSCSLSLNERKNLSSVNFEDLNVSNIDNVESKIIVSRAIFKPYFRNSWLSYSILISTAMSLFTFATWPLVSNLTNFEWEIHNTCNGYHPISYYSLEELLRPYIQLEWHQPPVI